MSGCSSCSSANLAQFSMVEYFKQMQQNLLLKGDKDAAAALSTQVLQASHVDPNSLLDIQV